MSLDSIFTNRAGSSTGNDRNIRASMMLKMAVFAPMPSASDNTAVAVNAGLPNSERIPKRRSRMTVSIRVSRSISRMSSLRRV